MAAAADTLAGRTGAALAVLQSASGAMLAVHGHREEADMLRHCTAAVAGRCAAWLRTTAGGRAGAQAVATYTAATLLRLAAVYTFRSGPAGLPDRLASAALELRRVP